MCADEQAGTVPGRLDPSLRAELWLELVPAPAAILDESLSILAANRELAALCAPAGGAVVGRRLGEAVGCAHCEAGSRCGETPHCPACGAFSALRSGAPPGQTARGLCRLLRVAAGAPESFELEVRATVLETADGRRAVVTLRDVSAEARVELLEGVFVHDLRNCLAGALGYAELLVEELGETGRGAEEARNLVAALGNMAEAIAAHRQLVDAEKGRLRPARRPVRPEALLEGVRRTYARHAAAAGRGIAVSCTRAAELETDPNILARALGNLLINALEASLPGETVAMTCRDDGDAALFEVRNRAAIPAADQLRIFHRTFTTKDGKGRGVGTHAVKLLVERYLGGAVGFASAEGAGTVFTVRLPAKSG